MESTRRRFPDVTCIFCMLYSGPSARGRRRGIVMRHAGKLSVLIVCVMAATPLLAGTAPEAAPAEGAARDADLMQGLSYLHQGMFNRGQVRFRAFLQAHPTDPHGHLFLAF